jgi:hypothetical protein
VNLNHWIADQISARIAIDAVAATHFLKKPGQMPFLIVENSLMAEPDEQDRAKWTILSCP